MFKIDAGNCLDLKVRTDIYDVIAIIYKNLQKTALSQKHSDNGDDELNNWI